MKTNPGRSEKERVTGDVMVRALAIMNTLSKAFDMLTMAVDLDKTLSDVLSMIKELLEAKTCSLMTIDGDTLRIVAHEGLNPEHVAQFNDEGVKTDSGQMAAIVAITQETFVSGRNDGESPFKAALVGKDDDTSSVCTPMVSDDQELWGVLSINLAGKVVIEDWVVAIILGVATTIANGMRRRNANRNIQEFKESVLRAHTVDAAVHTLIKVLSGLKTIGPFSIHIAETAQSNKPILRGVADSRPNSPAKGQIIPLNNGTQSPLAIAAMRQEVVELQGARGKRMLIPLLYLGESSEKRVVGVLSVEIPNGTRADEDQIIISHIAETMGMAIGHLWVEGQIHGKYISALMETLAVKEGGRDGHSYTADHSRGMTDFALAIAAVMDLSPLETSALGNGGILHDIGKVGIPEKVLNSPGRLDDETFTRFIKPHPDEGRHIVERVGGHQNGVCEVVGLHQVWWNTRNEKERFRSYPAGIGGSDIPRVALVAAVADVADAVASKRPYHEAHELAEVITIIRGGVGSHFEKNTVDAWLTALDQGFEWRGNFIQMPDVLS